MTSDAVLGAVPAAEHVAQDQPARPAAPARLSGWEDGLTLLIAGAAFVAVAINVQASDWVRGLPPLVVVSLLALVVAYGLSRVPTRGSLLLLTGLFAGAVAVFVTLMLIVPGATLDVRSQALVSRMHHWWYAISQHGANRDALPIIVIMLALTWLGSFVGAWAIFRWRNAVLGLVPGAAALIWDAAFSPGEFSVTAVVYVLLGALLFMRLRVLREQVRWQRAAVPYPRFIALPVLNVTLWATVALLGAASLLPSGSESSTANARWHTLTSPLTSHLASVAGAFVGINPAKGAKITALKDQLLLQGVISLSDLPAGTVEVSVPPDVAPFIRAQSFQQYRRDGWQVNGQSSQSLPPGAAADVQDPRDGTSPLLRKPVAITVTTDGGNGDKLLSIGQPLKSNRSDSATTGADRPDVSSIEPSSHLSDGTQYTVIGSASAATPDQLRAAGTDYPSWVTQSYLQVSRRTPGSVGARARQVTAGTTNPYDAASAIEAYIRTFPVDYSVPPPPDGQDPVYYFLFNAKRGYYNYDASAMTVMLRTLGIPARLASGYVLDPSQRNPDGTYDLTLQQSFAWPEVFFPGAGWVEFNPTPSQPLVPRPSVAQTQIPPEPPLPPAPPDGGSSVLTMPGVSFLGDATRAVSPRMWLNLGLLLLASMALAAVAGGVAAWQWGLRGLAPAERAWEQSLRLASLAGRAPAPHDTPRGYAAVLARDVPAAGGVAYIASQYERTRFGNKQLSPDEHTRLRAAWLATRAALLRRILRIDRRRPGAA